MTEMKHTGRDIASERVSYRRISPSHYRHAETGIEIVRMTPRLSLAGKSSWTVRVPTLHPQEDGRNYRVVTVESTKNACHMIAEREIVAMRERIAEAQEHVAEAQEHVAEAQELAAQVAKESAPPFPEGTPEYMIYRARLRMELAKFAQGQHPYPREARRDPQALTVRELAAALQVLLDEGLGGLKIAASLLADPDELSCDAQREVDSWDWAIVDLVIAGELPDVWLDFEARPVRDL